MVIIYHCTYTLKNKNYRRFFWLNLRRFKNLKCQHFSRPNFCLTKYKPSLGSCVVTKKYGPYCFSRYDVYGHKQTDKQKYMCELLLLFLFVFIIVVINYYFCSFLEFLEDITHKNINSICETVNISTNITRTGSFNNILIILIVN